MFILMWKEKRLTDLKALKVQGVDVVGKSIAEGNDLYSTVS